MKKISNLTTMVLTVIFSLLMISSCEVFNPSYEEFELYGSWDLEDLSLDIDISGDNKEEVLAARALVTLFKGQLERELDKQVDSLGGNITFNDDNTYFLHLMEETDTGMWYFNEEASSISLSAEEASIDELHIERLNTQKLIISWMSDLEEFESDSANNFYVQVTIEAVLLKEE